MVPAEGHGRAPRLVRPVQAIRHGQLRVQEAREDPKEKDPSGEDKYVYKWENVDNKEQDSTDEWTEGNEYF